MSMLSSLAPVAPVAPVAPIAPIAPVVQRIGRSSRGPARVEASLLDQLVKQTIVTPAQVRDAEQRANLVGTTPSVVLLTQGHVNRLTLWKAKAAVWHVAWVDVRTELPDERLVQSIGVDRCFAAGMVPYCATRSRLTIATSVDPRDEQAMDSAEAMRLSLVHAGLVNADIDACVDFVVCSDLDIDHVLLDACRDDVLWDAADRLTHDHPDQTAATGPAPWNFPVLVGLLAVTAVAFLVRPVATLAVVSTLCSVLFLFGTSFKALAAAAGAVALFRREKSDLKSLIDEAEGRANPSARTPLRIAENELPMYTILVPAYREEAVIGKLIRNMEGLDYPREKLDVIVLLEEDDELTLNAAKKQNPPGYVRLFVTPNGTPKTKPRACNAGLRFAKGEYLVIYDAEDRPDPGQLRDVLNVFNAASPETVVVQGRLNYFNANSNMLTRFFALEYAAWFDNMLPGLDALRLPIPLGGTSNHFVTETLRELGGWDAHNVTEDADLGLRATVEGYRVGVVDSTTWEEACSAWMAWIKQRTRWIKGYMVTALVHTRHPAQSFRKLGPRGTFGLLALIAGTPLTFLALPVAWLLSGVLFVIAKQGHSTPLSGWALKITAVNLFFGYCAAILMSFSAVTRRRAWWLAPFAVLNPFYWCLHSISAWRALWQLFVTPSVWEKTPHGIDANHQ
jgi:glycosyltransferase XagB